LKDLTFVLNPHGGVGAAGSDSIESPHH